MNKSILLLSSALILASCGNKNDQVKNTANTTALKSGIDLQYVDKSYRPQDDFYRYVNGKWLKNYKMPADKSRYGSFDALREKSRKDVKNIIDELAKKTYPKDSDEQKIGDFYRSFMDTQTIEERGLSVLNKDLAKIDAISNIDDLTDYMVYASMFLDAPMGLYVYVDLKDSESYVPYIGQAGLGLPDRDYYFNQGEKYKNIRQKYLELIENQFTNAHFANPKQSAKKIMDLETKIAEGHWTNVQRRDTQKAYNPKNKKELQALMPNINTNKWLAGEKVAQVDKFIVAQPDYLQKLNTLIKQTSLSDWKNYYRWKLLNATSTQLPQNIEQENFKFYGTVLRGTTEQEPRWKRGINAVNGGVGELVGKEYVKTYFPPVAKKRMDEMIENLRTAYGDSIKELDWMSEATKAKALDKLAKFDPKIGYPSKWKDYSSLHIAKDKLFENMRNITKWRINRNRNRLGKPVDKTEWSMNPQTVNAYYNPTKNEIVFPAAILQPPFFNMEADDAVNYGGIGAVIGHEMGHGFDDQGSLFDGDGNLKSWWTDEDRKEFKKKTALLIEQFNNYKVLDGKAHVNGELTQGENIGDLSGVTIAYKAYKKAHPENNVIDGLSGDERFFFGWAQVWRGKMRDEALLQQVATNPHSPAQFRGNGPLRNFPPFLKLYNVQPGDKMYLAPEKRVKIW